MIEYTLAFEFGIGVGSYEFTTTRRSECTLSRGDGIWVDDAIGVVPILSVVWHLYDMNKAMVNMEWVRLDGQLDDWRALFEYFGVPFPGEDSE